MNEPHLTPDYITSLPYSIFRPNTVAKIILMSVRKE